MCTILKLLKGSNNMNLIDKFLKKINASRNTFATYILTLITLYLALDRVIEMLLMIFTGVSYSYWGPISYTFAMACPILAFLFSGKSEFVSSKTQKVTLFHLFVISLYLIVISMFTQWLNMVVWLLLVSTPDYSDLVSNFNEVIRPAMVSISLILPLATAFPLFKWLYLGINDSTSHVRSIWDYGGISLADETIGKGPYTCEVFMCVDEENGKKITFNEKSRYQSLFVCGGTGTGKTSLVFEPMIAKDIEKKNFFKEVSCELGFTALKTRIAVLTHPWDNKYLNDNFNLNMLTPAKGKEAVYNAFVKKMILDNSGPETIFRDLGVTVVSPDYEIIDHMTKVCNNFNVKYNLVDPNNLTSIGLNPFVYDDPIKIAITISSAIRSMYNTSYTDLREPYREDDSIVIIENLAILLKEMYPRLNDGLLPNMEDLLMLMTNFELVEKMSKIMEHNEELSAKYPIQISFYKKHFYSDGVLKDKTQQEIFSSITQLDSLLRINGVKSILCNRYNNINFDDMLNNGEFTFVCTRRGDLGAAAHKAFGIFFLISMQNAVLRRPGTENDRIPNFTYIDEFPEFISKSTEAIFTMYRKYKVATCISSQNLSQLNFADNISSNYQTTILSNCSSKIFTGNGVPEELEWWAKEFGQKREWKFSDTMDFKTGKYDSKHGNVQWKYVDSMPVGKLQTSLSGTKCAFKIKQDNGSYLIGNGKFAYLSSKYKEKHNNKIFDFGKFIDSTTEASSTISKKTSLKNSHIEDIDDEIDPIKSEPNIFFNNDDAIVINLNNKKN